LTDGPREAGGMDDPAPDVERLVSVPAGYDFDQSLRFLPLGAFDPTCRREAGSLWKAVRTPAGAATLHLFRTEAGVAARAWGPGGRWALDRVEPLLGLHDAPASFRPSPGRLAALARRSRGAHLSRSPWVFDRLTGIILQQRVRFRDAARARRRLVQARSERAPGPLALLLPLAPRDWLRLSSEDFRRAGVDGERAARLRAAARHARLADAAFALDLAAARVRLAGIPGCGPWTVGMTMGFGLGDPDAVPVGDLHLPCLVAWALAGEEGGDDRRMLELLEPYRGHRFRLVRLLLVAGASLR
jgi:3-methyladenine DNA glycosylase/8-oxoguanine DNA glycosylase